MKIPIVYGSGKTQVNKKISNKKVVKLNKCFCNIKYIYMLYAIRYSHF